MKHDVIEELFSKYYNDALLYTISLCRNKSVAEDIVSSAFYKALTTADGEILNFKPWLFKVCRNFFISGQRRSTRAPTVELEENLSDGEEELVDEIIKDEEYRALYRAIELLPTHQREVITLFYFENLPIRDISEITSKTEVNIKVTLYRARDTLKNILEPSK